jgi:hypothetical protein
MELRRTQVHWFFSCQQDSVKSTMLVLLTVTKYGVKVKQSRYRPGVVQRVPGSYKFPDYMTTAQDGGKVVSLTHRPPLPPRKCSWYLFLLEAESTPGP